MWQNSVADWEPDKKIVYAYQICAPTAIWIDFISITYFCIHKRAVPRLPLMFLSHKIKNKIREEVERYKNERSGLPAT
jgi:hypothetical protein